MFVCVCVCVCVFCCCCFGQTTSKSVTVNHIQYFQSMSHTQQCVHLYCWNDIWNTWAVQPSAFQYCNCHPNCHHSLHQVILTESTVVLTTRLSIVSCSWTMTQGHKVSYVLVDACQGWIRHAGGFPPAAWPGPVYSLWCWRGYMACRRPKTGCWGRIISFVVLCSIVLYSIVHLFKEYEYWGVPQATLITVFL